MTMKLTRRRDGSQRFMNWWRFTDRFTRVIPFHQVFHDTVRHGATRGDAVSRCVMRACNATKTVIQTDSGVSVDGAGQGIRNLIATDAIVRLWEPF